MSNNQNSLKVVLEQTTNNTTSWIGNYESDKKNIKGGQTFMAPSEADLEAIKVFSSIVTIPGEVVMTVHHFDTTLKSWGPTLISSKVQFSRADSGSWKSFDTSGLHLTEGKTYGFILEGLTSCIGMGEAVGSHVKPPHANGQEWRFTNNNQQGDSFNYFSLAFKIEARA